MPVPPPSTDTVRTAVPRRIDGATRFFDWVSDIAVLAYAWWTLLYQTGELLHLRTNPLMVLWLIGIAALVLLTRRWGRDDGSANDQDLESARGPLPWLFIAGATVAAVSALVTCLKKSDGIWVAGWVLGLGAVAVAVVQVLVADRRSAIADDVAPEGGHGWGSLLVIVVGTGLAVLSTLTLRVDPDDAFYVNKAVFVAEHGTIPIRDTLFSEQSLPALTGAGSAPIQSIEVLQGAIAHLLGAEAGTIVYLVFPPVCTALATWAIWRLLRTWAPRRQLLCWVVSMTYLFMAASAGAGFGVFFLARIWQGKVIFVAALVPLIYLYITRWAATGQRRWAVLLLAAGISAVGLTSSATFLVPIIAGASAVALLVARRRFAGVLLLLAYPVLTGVIVAIVSPPGDPGGEFFASQAAYRFVLSVGGIAAVAWFAVLVAPWLARRGAHRIVVTAAALALVVVLAPGFGTLFSDLTGAGAVAWRLVWVAPVTAMVGLLAAAPGPLEGRVAARVSFGLRSWVFALPAVVIVVTVLLQGTPLTAHVRNVTIQPRPTWKYPEPYIAQASAIAATRPGPGPVLANRSVMRALSLVSSAVQAVDPRTSYLSILDEDPTRHAARVLLSDMTAAKAPMPPVSEVRSALATLDVSLACFGPHQRALRRTVSDAGWQPTHDIKGLKCYLP